MKKLIAAVLAMMLIICAAAFAESDVAALEARIAELEAEVALYKPYYDAQVVASYDGGVIMRDEAMAEYEYTASMYASYGIDLAAYGMDGAIKESIVNGMVKDAARAIAAEALGLAELTEEEAVYVEAQADEQYEGYIAYVSQQMAAEGEDVETYREDAIAYLDSVGYTRESIAADLTASLVSEKFNDYAIADVVVTEEDIVATYDAHVAADTADFADSRTYTSARNGGETLYYNPEGYRQVKQVLIKFDDTQSAAYSDLSATLTSLEAEMDAIVNPVEEEATEEEATEEAAEPRTVEEVQADIDAVNAEIEALYAELMPTVEEVITAFNNGTAFADLIAQYNQDPGMMNEPTATLGYPVSADSASYDPAFKDAAMSIENIGEIAEPARGSYGIYIVYYDADIVSGAVDMESVRTVLEEETLISMQTEAVNALVDEWVAAINPVYFYENMK